MKARIDGLRIFYRSVGAEDHYPIVVLHGGGGLDHTYLRPWFDPLSERFRVLFVDLRGHGRSERVDPATVSLPVLAADVSKLAGVLGLKRYAVLGHSFGAFVALTHAIEDGTASHYVLAHGSASLTKTAEEITANISAFEPTALRDQLTQGWALETTATTAAEIAEAWRLQLPMHFARPDSPAYHAFVGPDGGLARTLWAPGMASVSVTLEYEEALGQVRRPTLIVTGEYDRVCTPRASREMHIGIRGSDLTILAGVGHMGMAERPDLYLEAIRRFFERHPLGASSRCRCCPGRNLYPTTAHLYD